MRLLLSVLYRELLLLARANLLWFVLTLPAFGFAFLLTFTALRSLDPLGEAPPLLLPPLVAAFLCLALPTPAGAGLYRLAHNLVSTDNLALSLFWTGVREYWQEGARMFVLGLGGVALSAANVVFYTRSDGLWPLAVVWAYAGLAWLALQPYLFPLLLAASAEGLPRRYWRAAVLAVTHPGTSLLLLAATLFVTLGSVLVPPVYPLLGMALLSVLGTQVFGRLRARAEAQRP